MSNLIPQEELQNFSWLLESWAWSFVGALKGMGLEQPKWEAVGEVEVLGPPVAAAPAVEETAEDAPAEETPAAEAAPEPVVEQVPLLWWAQSFSLYTASCVWFGAAEEIRRTVGRDSLIAAGLEEPEAADIQNTYYEIAATTMSGLAKRLEARCGREVTSLAGQPVDSFETRGVVRQVSVEMPSGEKLTLKFAVSSEFLKFLVQTGFYRESGWIARDQRSGDRRGPGARADGSGADRKPAVRRDVLPIESVLDMDIPVSISFGAAKLRLDEALRLHEGSLVVLNKTIDELVELQVNGRVVARGEIMAARGQYGIRILELSSQGERMAHIDPEHRSELEASLNN